MAGAAKPGFGSRWTARGAALTCLVLAACAGAKPPVIPKAPPAPMITPQPPPSSPEFNARMAKALPLPEPPNLGTMATPAAPGPVARMEPLPHPPPLDLSAAPVAEPGTPPMIAHPLPRPTAGAAPPDDTGPAADPMSPPVLAPQPGGDAGVEGSFRLLFAPGSPDLPAAAAGLLREIADSMAREPTLRLRIAAYASGDAENPVPARRLSLQRALKVREALAGEGIASLRVDIQALGLGDGSTPRDRVDLIPIR